MDRNILLNAFRDFLSLNLALSAATADIPIPIADQYIVRATPNFLFDPLPRLYIFEGTEDVTERGRRKERELEVVLTALVNPSNHRTAYPLDADCINAFLKQIQLVANTKPMVYDNKQIPVFEEGNDIYYIVGDPSFMAVEITVTLKYITDY
jgi:hypothetical protein